MHIPGTEGLSRLNNWTTMLPTPKSTNKIPGYPDSVFSLQYPSWPPTILDSSGKNLYSSYASLAYFIGRTPTINYQDTNTFFWHNIYSAPVEISTTQAHDGDTVCMVAYPSCAFTEYGYYDGNNYKTAFSGFGPPSNTVKIILP